MNKTNIYSTIWGGCWREKVRLEFRLLFDIWVHPNDQHHRHPTNCRLFLDRQCLVFTTFYKSCIKAMADQPNVPSIYNDWSSQSFSLTGDIFNNDQCILHTPTIMYEAKSTFPRRPLPLSRPQQCLLPPLALASLPSPALRLRNQLDPCSGTMEIFTWITRWIVFSRSPIYMYPKLHFLSYGCKTKFRGSHALDYLNSIHSFIMHWKGGSLKTQTFLGRKVKTFGLA